MYQVLSPSRYLFYRPGMLICVSGIESMKVFSLPGTYSVSGIESMQVLSLPGT